MGMVCAVSFERYGRLYYLDPGPYAPAVGDKVLVPTDDGPEVAECVWAPQWVSEDTEGMPVLQGIATADDLERDALIRRRKADARVAAKRLVREHKLPMKIVGVDHVPRPLRQFAPGPTSKRRDVPGQEPVHRLLVTPPRALD